LVHGIMDSEAGFMASVESNIVHDHVSSLLASSFVDFAVPCLPFAVQQSHVISNYDEQMILLLTYENNSVTRSYFRFSLNMLT
jgi:hypothetical protein